MPIGWDMVTHAIPGSYDVINTSRNASRFRSPAQQVAAATKAKAIGGRSKPGLKLLTFIAGTITAFGLSAGLKAAGVTSGLTRSVALAGVGLAGSWVGGKLSGAPGTFAYGVTLGGALASAYEGWGVLKDLRDKYGWVVGYPDGFVPHPDANSVIWNYGTIVYKP